MSMTAETLADIEQRRRLRLAAAVQIAARELERSALVLRELAREIAGEAAVHDLAAMVAQQLD